MVEKRFSRPDEDAEPYPPGISPEAIEEFEKGLEEYIAEWSDDLKANIEKDESDSE